MSSDSWLTLGAWRDWRGTFLALFSFSSDFDWFGPIISTTGSTVVSFGLLSISLWNSSGRWWNAFEISNFEWLETTWGSDEWCPTLLHPLSLGRKRNKETSLFNKPPSWTFFSQNFFECKISLKAKQNAFNEPTRMMPLQSERAILGRFFFLVDNWARHVAWGSLSCLEPANIHLDTFGICGGGRWGSGFSRDRDAAPDGPAFVVFLIRRAWLSSDELLLVLTDGASDSVKKKHKLVNVSNVNIWRANVVATNGNGPTLLLRDGLRVREFLSVRRNDIVGWRNAMVHWFL